jgi:protein-arginine kinase activator protein McsA
MSNHDFRNVPVCPHCDFEDSDQIADMDCTDDTENALTCPNCGKDYKALVHVDYTYDTYTNDTTDKGGAK